MLKCQPNQRDILLTWRSQLTAMVHTKPWLVGMLLRRSRRLYRRFAHFYRRLQVLPRRQRRLLQRKLGAPLAGTALLLALSGGSVQANNITVAAGLVNINGNDGRCSLIEAIENANDAGSGRPHSDCAAGDPAGADTIHLPAGSVFTLQAINNIRYETGLPVISSNITIEGNGAAINRDSAAPAFGMLAINRYGQLTLNETTISGGFKEGIGGGVFQREGGPLTIKNSIISGNRSTIDGGGVYIRYGPLTIDNSTITGNQATNSGGGIFQLTGMATINNSTISGNRATNNGGGLVNYVVETTISNSTISGNRVTNSGGGMVNNYSKIIINNSTVSDNQARKGGGMFNEYSELIINNSTLSGNRATSGGGVYVFSDSTATINNTTISGNEAATNGGGLFNHSSNTGLNRSLISGNTAPLGAEVSNAGVINADNYNLFGHAGLGAAQAFSNFTPGVNDLNAAGDGYTPTALTGILNTTLADNGGDTQTHALVFGSPALDAAPSNDCAAAPINGVDQRGRPRNIANELLNNNGTACDIGAFELQAGQLTISKKLTNNTDLVPILFIGPLGAFTLTTNTAADTQTFDLPSGVYTFIENFPNSRSPLLGINCLDDQGNDAPDEVADFFINEELSATITITLTGENGLHCTFLNEHATFEAEKNYYDRLYMPILVK